MNDAEEARAVASLASAVSADTTRIAREAAAVVEAATGSTETDIDGVVSDETKDDKSDPNAMTGANIFEIMEEAHKALEEHLKSENAAQKALESVDSLTKISPIDNKKDKDTDELIKTISENFEKAKTEKMSKSEIFQLLFEKASINSKWSSHWYECSSGDLSVMLSAIKNYLLNDELELKDTKGYWTLEQDELLKKGNEDDIKELVKIHGTDNVEKRKSKFED